MILNALKNSIKSNMIFDRYYIEDFLCHYHFIDQKVLTKILNIMSLGITYSLDSLNFW